MNGCEFNWVEVFDPAARGPLDVEQCSVCGVYRGDVCQQANVALPVGGDDG